MKPISTVAVVGAGTLWTGLALFTVGLCTPHWVEFEGLREDGVTYSGSAMLFQLCVNNFPCIELPDPSDMLKTVRALAVTGLVCGVVGGVAVVAAIIPGVSIRMAYRFYTLADFANTTTFSLIATAIGLFAQYVFKPSKEQLGYSFFLSIAGAVLFLVGAGLFYAGGKPDPSANQRGAERLC